MAKFNNLVNGMIIRTDDDRPITEIHAEWLGNQTNYNFKDLEDVRVNATFPIDGRIKTVAAMTKDELEKMIPIARESLEECEKVIKEKALELSERPENLEEILPILQKYRNVQSNWEKRIAVLLTENERRTEVVRSKDWIRGR